MCLVTLKFFSIESAGAVSLTKCARFAFEQLQSPFDTFGATNFIVLKATGGSIDFRQRNLPRCLIGVD